MDANGIPLGAIAALANRHDLPLLEGTLDTMEILGELPERISTYLDRGYDSNVARQKPAERGLLAGISEKGRPDPPGTTKRWVVEKSCDTEPSSSARFIVARTTLVIPAHKSCLVNISLLVR